MPIYHIVVEDSNRSLFKTDSTFIDCFSSKWPVSNVEWPNEFFVSNQLDSNVLQCKLRFCSRIRKVEKLKIKNLQAQLERIIEAIKPIICTAVSLPFLRFFVFIILNTSFFDVIFLLFFQEIFIVDEKNLKVGIDFLSRAVVYGDKKALLPDVLASKFDESNRSK